MDNLKTRIYRQVLACSPGEYFAWSERPRVQDNTYVCAERSYVPGMHLYYWPRTRTRGEGSMNLYSYVYGHVPFWLKLSQVYIRWKSIGSRQFSWGREPVLVQHIVTNFFDSLVHGALWCFIYWPTDILKYCVRSWLLKQMFSERLSADLWWSFVSISKYFVW